MPLNPSPNPALSFEIPRLTGASVAHPDTWNAISQALLDNDAVIQAAVQTNKQATDQATSQLAQRLDGVESSSAVSVQKAQSLDWIYRNNAINFELFTEGYTLIDVASIAVVQGVAGDDSLDVAASGALKVNDYYVLTDPAAAVPVSELVQVVSVLSGARVRLSANLKNTWGPTATLSRSSLTIQSAGKAVADVGDIYLSKTINIGTDADGGAVVVRRSLGAGEFRLYYRDTYHSAWTECGWSYRRTGGQVPDGFGDFEYILPMRGEGSLRGDVVGSGMTISHLVALGQATGLGGFLNPALRPATPVMSSPVDLATNVTERPTLALASHSSPSGVAQAAVRFKLSKTADMSAPFHESGELASGLSYQVPALVLPVSTTVYASGSTKDVAGQWSDWSTPIRFTTAASYVYVVAPVMSAPANNALDVPAQPTLSTLAFAVSGGTDTHIGSRFRIRAAGGTYATPVYDSGTDTVNKLGIQVPANLLTANESVFYGQAAHQGSARGWSEWSAEVKFTTKKAFANIIGLVQLTSGGGSGSWARVDETGAAKATDAAYFGSHPIYGGVQDQIIDGQYMVKIPAFYVKRGPIASGAYAGKKALWISDQPAAGFALHPAFKNAGADMAQFWVGKYQAGPGGPKGLASVPGTLPAVGLNFPEMRSNAAARNTGGVTGFAMWNIYQLAAIQMLAMIEMGGSDSQVLLGSGNVDSASDVQSVSSAQVATASWRGVVGLWGNVLQNVDGATIDGDQKYMIWDRNGNKTYVTTATVLPPGYYTVTIAEEAGVNYDLRDLFLPASTDLSAANATYPDFFNGGPGGVMTVGGRVKQGNNCGLFNMQFGVTANGADSYTGTRLSKI